MSKTLILSAVIALGCVFANPLRAAEPAEIRLAHQLNADKAEQLGKLIERFNSASKSGRIVLVPYEGNANAELLLPAEEEELRVLSARRFKPVWELMRDARKPLEAFKQYPRMAMPLPLDDKGRLQALPMAFSTPVVYVNRPALKQVGIDPDNLPKAWLDWQNELGKLQTKSYFCPFTTTRPVQTFIENTGAWNAQAVTGMNGKEEMLATNGLIHVKHLAMMVTWHKANYLRLFGYGDEAEEQFASGNCVVMIASSASYADLQRKARFDIGVAPLPYHEGAYGAPQNTLADGSSLWIAAGKNAAAYRTAADFISFFLTPESQVFWQVEAGFLPLNLAGVMATTESKLLRTDLAAQRIAIAELSNKPVIAASAATGYMRRPGVRRILQQELDNAWAGKKTAKEALDDAVLRARSREAGCCRAVR